MRNALTPFCASCPGETKIDPQHVGELAKHQRRLASRFKKTIKEGIISMKGRHGLLARPLLQTKEFCQIINILKQADVDGAIT